MLVIVSDLHLCDGTAYPQNVTAASFGLLQQEVYGLAKRYHARNLDIVFLGDVFDLLRTERWFEDAAGAAVPLAERPWGYEHALDGAPPPEPTLARARGILQGILDSNKDTLSSLRGETSGVDAPDCPVRRIFLSGNHDRLYLCDDQLRATMRTALGAADESALSAEGIFPHYLAMPRYGVLARHGHEWDLFNFEAFLPDKLPSQYQNADYLRTPIGDPITTELVARLPYELCRRLAADPSFQNAADQLQSVRLRMEGIEDVRPLVSALRWVYYVSDQLAATLSEAQTAALRVALDGTVQTLAADFLALPYFNEWYERQHQSFRLDVALDFKAALKLLTEIDISKLGRLEGILSSLLAKAQGADKVTAGAAREDLNAVGDAGLRCVVYGHTHEPREDPMRVTRSTEDLYLNSGTWRRREFATDDKSGFIGWENFTYLAFYDEGEKMDASPRKGPGYECWNGSRLK